MVSFLNADVVLKVVQYVDLSSALSLSQTCSVCYQLSFSSLSYWIYSTDIGRLPVTISEITENFAAERVRWMVTIIVECGRNFSREDFVPVAASYCKFQDESLANIVDNRNQSYLGASSMYVRGCTSDSLPWLVTVQGNLLRCDCLDDKYATGIEWDAGSSIDVFWRCDLGYSSTNGVLEDQLTVTLTTNNSEASVIEVFNSHNTGRIARSTKLHVVTISLPSRRDIRPQETREPKSWIHFWHKLPATPPRFDIPSAKACRSKSVCLPTGFVNDRCRPSASGTKVYLLLKNKDTEPSVFWKLFVYDWKDDTGITCELPTPTNWRKVLGFALGVILLDWHGSVYGMPALELQPVFHTTDPRDPDPLSPWPCHTTPLPRPAHFDEMVTNAPWDPINRVVFENTNPLTGNAFPVSDNAFYLVSQWGSKLCCNMYRLSDSEQGISLCRIAGGFVTLPDHTGGRQYLSLKAGPGGRALAVASKTPEDSGKKLVSFFVIDFEIDYQYDGSEGVRRIHAVKREFQIERQVKALASKGKVLDVLDDRNIGEVYWDSFRGAVVILGKDYREAHSFHCTQF